MSFLGEIKTQKENLVDDSKKGLKSVKKKKGHIFTLG